MAASATNIQAKEGGTWRTITAISAKEGGIWRTVQEVWAKEGGTWRHSWINSDPQTYEYEPDWNQTYRGNHNQRSTVYLYQGYFSSTYGQHKSLMNFDHADIQSKLAIRPVISSITLQLSSEHFYKGDWNNPIGWTRHGGTTHATKPSTWNGSDVFGWADANGTEHTWTGGYAGARDQTDTVTLPIGVANDLRDDVIKTLSLYAETTSQNYYCYFWDKDASAALRPVLSITADYI